MFLVLILVVLLLVWFSGIPEPWRIGSFVVLLVLLVLSLVGAAGLVQFPHYLR